MSSLARFRSFIAGVDVSAEVGALSFIACNILGWIVLYNYPLLSFISDNINILSWHGFSALMVVVILLGMLSLWAYYLIFMLMPFLAKPFSMIIAVANSLAFYFMTKYHVVLDKAMMGNVFNTRTDEAADLFHPMILAYMVVLGIVPAFLVFRTRIKSVRRLRLTGQTLVITLVGVLYIYVNSSSWLWIDKHAKVLGGLLIPWSYVANSVRFKQEQIAQERHQELLPPATFNSDNKTVVVLVIGEAARAQNFSLYGYERNTNPYLTKSDILALDASACSTYTTASVLCMLSYTESDASDYEPLPSYLKRHGIDVIWRSANWGEPPIDVTTYEKSSDLKKVCEGEDCSFDSALLTNLVERIRKSEMKKIFVVLHTKGSHGPLYSTRYPKVFEKFQPVCETVELFKCSHDSLINAYDNTILYTDYFLNRVIHTLQELDDTPAIMIYVSDHGESLGEHGAYLHGAPYSIAPEYQIKVPFIVWRSTSFRALQPFHIDAAEVKARSYSHRNVFHTVMGAFDMTSPIYNPDLDIFSRRSNPNGIVQKQEHGSGSMSSGQAN